MVDHIGVVVPGVVSERLFGKVPEELTHQRRGCTIVQQRSGQGCTGLVGGDPGETEFLEPFGPNAAEPALR